MNCDMCGREGRVVRAIVEETELKVCESCVKYGKRMGSPPVMRQKPKRTIPEAPSERIVDDYAARIKQARERLNKTQKDFAHFIAEKESVVHHLETGHLKPSLVLARKLEKQLGMILVERDDDSAWESGKASAGSVTLGDFIKVRKG